MSIYLLGAEQPTNARLLSEAKAEHVGLSFHSLLPRLPKKKAYSLADRMPVAAVYLASGGHAYKGDVQAFMESYEEFVSANNDAIALATDVDRPDVDPEHLNRIHALLGDRLAPVWREDMGLSRLDAFAERFSTIGVRADTVRNSPPLAAKLIPLHARYGVRWHLLDGARLEDLMSGRFDSAASVAWLSPMKYGELLVWDGTRMQRYPTRLRETAMRRHKNAFTRAGFDADAIMDGDHNELTRYTVWAFQQMEARVDRKKPPNNPFRVISDEELEEEVPGTELLHVDNTPAIMRNEPSAVQPRDEPLTPMPGFGFGIKTDIEIGPEGERILVDRPLLQKSTVSLRQCDTCHVQSNCPAFKPSSACAYKFPVELKTKDQLRAAMYAILEMQYERVAFMQMQEQLNGGYADPNTSQEIDRLLKMQKTIKEIEDDRDYVRLQVEGKAQSGVLAQLFGERANKLRDLDEPMRIETLESRLIDPD